MQDHFAQALEKKKQAHVSTVLWRVRELDETVRQAATELRKGSTLGDSVWHDIQARALRKLAAIEASKEAEEDGAFGHDGL